MGMLAGYRRLVTASIGLLLLTGCGSPAVPPTATPPTATQPAPTPAASPSPSIVDGPITVHRMGGIAGVDDTLTVSADGRWSHGARSGKLADEQAAQVRELRNDPRLEAESKRQAGQTRCRDAFTFEVTVGDRIRVHYVDCPGDPDPPLAAMALVEYVYGVTAG